jgi:pseudouridine-5'-phosphate glycosidase
LAQTPVTVVAAGAKAILDLEKTFELLETLGVPVIAYGQDTLPAFWSATSHMTAPLRMDTAADIAAGQVMRTAMGLSGGQLICNPIPADAQIPADVLAPVIAQALAEADAQAISAKAVTPFLLGRIFELTEGRSLTANIALVRNNAVLAAKIAGEMAK